MQKVKLIVSMIAISLLFMCLVSAVEVKKSEIVINTEPYQNISLTIIDHKTNEELQTFTGKARKFGEYKVVYYGLINKILISASIINNETEETLLNKEFGPYTLGVSTITINFTLSEPEEMEIISINTTNVTNSSTSVTNQSASGKSPIIGFVTGGDGKFSNLYYYVGAGALGVIILLIVLRRKTRTINSPIEPHPQKVVKSKVDKPAKTEIIVPQNTTNQTSINETEKKIADLQKQLEQIRSEEKLIKLQKQLEQERQELSKLRSNNEPKIQDNQNKDGSRINPGF